MTRSLSLHLKRKTAKTTAELREHVKTRDPQRFAKGLYFKTRGGDVVRVNDVTWMSVYGTLWRQDSDGEWRCFGSRIWAISGRYYDGTAIDSIHDLTRIIAKPTWLEGVAA